MLIHTAKELGLRVRDQRRARGWSQTDLARRIGASRFWVGEMENGKETVELGLVLKVLRALDLACDVRDAGVPASDASASSQTQSQSAAARKPVDLAAIVARDDAGRTPLRPAPRSAGAGKKKEPRR